MIRERGLVGAVLLCVAVAACQKPVKPGDPVRGLTKDQRASFDRGAVVFDSAFTPETGLGPLFNADACGECHEDPVRGAVGERSSCMPPRSTPRCVIRSRQGVGSSSSCSRRPR